MLPMTEMRPVEEMLHGVRMQDPYRWLEDRSLPETEEWICGQNRHCDEYFSGCEDLEAIRSRVRQFLDVTTVDQPTRVGDRYFFRRRTEGEEQARIYVLDWTTGEERMLVDAPADPLSSVRIHRISHDGCWMAYEYRFGGSDRREIQFLDVSLGITLDIDVLADWSRGVVFDSHGPRFFYRQDTRPAAEHTIRRRSLLNEQADTICFRVDQSAHSRLLMVADENNIGALHMYRDGSAQLVDFWVATKRCPEAWHPAFKRRPAPFLPMLARGRLFALNFDGASNGRCAEFNWAGCKIRTVIPTQPDQIQQIVPVANSLFVHRFGGMKRSIQRWSLNGENLGQLDFPDGGTIQLLPPLGPSEQSLFYTWESFDKPAMLFEYSLGSGETKVWHRPSEARLSTEVGVATSVFPSYDGTQIPVTLVTAARACPNKRVPALMTAYGGFGVPSTPQFSVLVGIMLELGVRFVLPHIRGGGDLGQEWHEAGRGRNRQTSINDFLAAAEWLREQGMATAGNLASFGGSNSGLLVAAAMTQRPDLFRAVLCIAPLLDMIRYEHFDRAARWIEEYGSVQDEADFHALHAYSPYHQVKDHVGYPATLFVTGDMDDRCDPAHVRKMVALLQQGAKQTSPILMDYSEARGHSPALPLSVRIDALARRIAFLCRELRVPANFGGLDDAPSR